MFKLLPKVILALIFWGIFTYVIFQIPYPESITQANPNQLLSFFIPLFLAIALTLNIFLKNILISISISLGLIISFFSKALDALNIVTGILILTASGLLISYFKKVKRKNLTKWGKIPKLTKLRK